MKTIVVDSSSIITLSSSCLIRLMKHLANEEGISFVIPESVYNESVKRPVKIKRFELNAVRIRDAVEEGYLKLARTTPEITREMHRMHDITMRMCTIRGRECRLVDLGEAETLALAKKLGSDTLLIDERTTRTLIEGPDRLAEFLKRRHGVPVQLNKSAISEFRQEFGHIKVIRSTELIALAYDNRAFDKELHHSKQALEAALYSAKFAGCAISISEIQEYLKGVRT